MNFVGQNINGPECRPISGTRIVSRNENSRDFRLSWCKVRKTLCQTEGHNLTYWGLFFLKKWVARMCALWHPWNGLHRFTSSGIPSDLLMASIAVEPFLTTDFQALVGLELWIKCGAQCPLYSSEPLLLTTSILFERPVAKMLLC